MSKPAAARDGQPQHQTKITVVGVEGRAAADAVGRYHAQLAHFQAAEQQRLLLSPEGVDIHRGYATFEGATAVYTNSFGQETIVLQVKPTEQGEERPQESTVPWDTALFELIWSTTLFDDDARARAGNASFMLLVDGKIVDYTQPLPQKAIAFDFTGSSQTIGHDAIVKSASDIDVPLVDGAAVTEGVAKFRTSFKVNLRSFNGAVVKLQLWAATDWTINTNHSATMQFGIFRGDPFDVCSEVDYVFPGMPSGADPEDYTFTQYQFENSKTYPVRPKLGDVPFPAPIPDTPAHIGPGGPGGALGDSLHLMGTIVIDATRGTLGFKLP